jgi:hypothetical protein
MQQGARRCDNRQLAQAASKAHEAGVHLETWESDLIRHATVPSSRWSLSRPAAYRPERTGSR